MTTPPPIPPALTPDEWREPRRYFQADHYDDTERGVADLMVEPGRLAIREHPGERDCAVFETPGDLAKLLALANAALPDGDPRKITRADVHACADASMFAGPHPALARLALKLAALLRPEGT